MTAPRDEEGDPLRAAQVAGHIHAFDHETLSSPDHAGRVTVIEWCACGQPIHSSIDTIL